MRKKYGGKKGISNRCIAYVVVGALLLIQRKGIYDFTNFTTKTALQMSGIVGGMVIAFLLVEKGIKAYQKSKKKKRYLTSNLAAIDHMSGIEFEEYLKAHFEKLGYRVQLTSKSNDYGADLVLIKDSVKTVVQAKRYKNKVSNSAIQEVLGAKGYYEASKAMVITNSFFTANAINLAKRCEVELWDRNKLINVFQKNKEDNV